MGIWTHLSSIHHDLDKARFMASQITFIYVYCVFKCHIISKKKSALRGIFSIKPS
jgi:hypothetical protein